MKHTMAQWITFCFIFLFMAIWAKFASGNIETSIQKVWTIASDIHKLQPHINDYRVIRLASIFAEAEKNTNIDYKILIVVAFRETSFHEDFESRTKFGSRGEIGLMQCHGVALKFRPEECSRDLPSARCQILTGANFLAYSRKLCGGSTWAWVASYGYGRCLTNEEAVKTKCIKNAKRYYKLIGGIEIE